MADAPNCLVCQFTARSPEVAFYVGYMAGGTDALIAAGPVTPTRYLCERHERLMKSFAAEYIDMLRTTPDPSPSSRVATTEAKTSSQ